MLLNVAAAIVLAAIALSAAAVAPLIAPLLRPKLLKAYSRYSLIVDILITVLGVLIIAVAGISLLGIYVALVDMVPQTQAASPAHRAIQRASARASSSTRISPHLRRFRG